MTDRNSQPEPALQLRDPIGSRASGDTTVVAQGPDKVWSGRDEHPLITIPFTAFIDGRQFVGQCVSLVEVQVAGLVDPALDGEERLVRLAFEFQGFSVTLNPKMRIERTSSRDLVLHFTDPAGPHLPQLRHILNEYISGDLVALGSVIRVGPLDGPKGGAATARRGFGGWILSVIGTLAAFGATVALVVVAWMLIENRLFVTDFATPGRIIEEGQTLRAVAGGQISFLDLQAGEGDVVVAIAATSGETLSLAMPCDCTIRALGVLEGSTVLPGETILRLTAPDAPTLIELEVPARDAIALMASDSAEFRLPGGAWQKAILIPGEGRAPNDNGMVLVRFAPVGALDTTATGGLVEMRAIRDFTDLFSPITDRLSVLTGAEDPLGSSNFTSRFAQFFKE